MVQHAAQWLADHGAAPDLICCIYATAPFIRPDDLALARAKLLEDADAGVCVPVTEYVFTIQCALRMKPGGYVEMFDPEHMTTRSQDLEPAWHDTGQFYYGRFGQWLAGRPMFGGDCVGLPIEQWRVQDIDTPDDWRRAELLFRQIEGG